MDLIENTIIMCSLLATAGCTVPPPPQRQVVEAQLPVDGIVTGAAPGQVALVEFGSFSCPICYEFSEHILPQIDSIYLSPKRITYRYIEVSPIKSIDAAAGALANCAASAVGFPHARRLVYSTQGFQSFGEAPSEVAQQTGQSVSALLTRPRFLYQSL